MRGIGNISQRGFLRLSHLKGRSEVDLQWETGYFVFIRDGQEQVVKAIMHTPSRTVRGIRLLGTIPAQDVGVAWVIKDNWCEDMAYLEVRVLMRSIRHRKGMSLPIAIEAAERCEQIRLQSSFTLCKYVQPPTKPKHDLCLEKRDVTGIMEMLLGSV